MRTAVDEIVAWSEIVLICGGLIGAMAGVLMYKIDRLARYSDPNVKPGRWLAISFVALAMVAAGFALLRYVPSTDSHRQNHLQPADDAP